MNENKATGLHRSQIRVVATAVLVLGCALAPTAAYGAAMALMKGVLFAALVSTMLVLVLLSIALSIWSPLRPGWRAVLASAICLMPGVIVYSRLLL
jgi:hypothetical protein